MLQLTFSVSTTARSINIRQGGGGGHRDTISAGLLSPFGLPVTTDAFFFPFQCVIAGDKGGRGHLTLFHLQQHQQGPQILFLLLFLLFRQKHRFTATVRSTKYPLATQLETPAGGCCM